MELAWEARSVNFRGAKIVEELRADAKCRDLPIVILADLPEKPVRDERVHFIDGEVETDLCVGIENSGEGKFVPNPDKDYRLSPEDRLIVIARERPEIA